MLQIPGKTRRGRPPKYQQYWITLAKQKAEERLQQSAAAVDLVDKEKNELKSGAKSIQQECKQVELNQLQRPNHLTTGAGIQSTNASTLNVLPLFQDRNRHPEFWTLDPGVIQPRDRTLNMKRISVEEDLGEETRTAKKRFRQEQQNKVLCSTWKKELSTDAAGCNVPVMMTIPAQQAVTILSSMQFSPEVRPADTDGRLDRPSNELQGNRKPEDTSEDEELRASEATAAATLLKNWLIDVERSEYVLDLSKSKKRSQSLEIQDQEPNSTDGGELTPLDRQTMNAVDPLSWNSDMAQPCFVPNELSKKDLLVHSSPLRTPFWQLSVKNATELVEVSTWSVDQVANFVSLVPGCHDYAECFRHQGIDGVCLLQLSEYHLLDIMRMKLGPSLHLKRAVDDLIRSTSITVS